MKTLLLLLSVIFVVCGLLIAYGYYDIIRAYDAEGPLVAYAAVSWWDGVFKVAKLCLLLSAMVGLIVGASHLLNRYLRVTAVMLLTFVISLTIIGCASIPHQPTTNLYGEDCAIAATDCNPCIMPIRSNWWYAWIDDCPETADRMTWVEYYALTIADQISEWRER